MKLASRGASQTAGQGVREVLQALARSSTALSSEEVARLCGRERANGYLKRILTVLADDGLIGTTSVRRRGARQQKYLITVKGRDVAKKVTTPKTTLKTTPKTALKTTPKNALSAAAKVMMAAIRRNPSITVDELMSVSGLSRDGVNYQIRQLKSFAGLYRVGGRKIGSWAFEKKGGGR